MYYNKVEICGLNTSKLKVLTDEKKKELLNSCLENPIDRKAWLQSRGLQRVGRYWMDMTLFTVAVFSYLSTHRLWSPYLYICHCYTLLQHENILLKVTTKVFGTKLVVICYELCLNYFKSLITHHSIRGRVGSPTVFLNNIYIECINLCL